MPTYDYQCRACGTITEVIHSMLEDGPSACELCGGDLRRVLYPTGIIFKGPGFYRTDSRKVGSTDAGAASSPASEGSLTPSPGSSGAASDAGSSPSRDSGSEGGASGSTGTKTGTKETSAS